MKLKAWLSNNESYRFDILRKHANVKSKGTMSPCSTKLLDTIKISSIGLTA